MLTLNGATFQAGQNSNSHWDYFSPYIYVNGTAVSGQVAWATEGMYANTSQFCFFLAQDILRQDGSDVIEVREGCRIPLNDGADYYVVSETATFAAPANATGSGTEQFVRQFSWAADTKYDASGEIFVTNSAQQGVLGGYDSQGVAIGNMSQDHPEWGLPLTEYSAQTINALAEGSLPCLLLPRPLIRRRSKA